MLTISKPLSAGQAQSYHQKEFTAREQNYWSQRGETMGEWQGRLAEKFGLAGAVAAEEFARLSQGQHPQTGEQLVRQRASYEYKDGEGNSIKTMEHRAGWDATFSAPKSVSLTALVGGDHRVREAHREAVRTALEHLEHYTLARIGGNHPAEATGKFVVAKFEHDTARPVDGYAAPQLHTHAVVFNMTERQNGQYRALQPQSLFASQQFATAIYQSELTYRLRQLGYEITVGRSGAPEVKGYTQEYLDASSPRSQQIRDYLERTGRNGKEAAEIAAHSTRDHKEIHSLGEVMAAHGKLAGEYGNQAEAIVRAAQERARKQSQEVNPQQRVRESLTFSRDKNFEREAVVDERAIVRDALRRGMGYVTYSQVRANLNTRMASGEFQAIERPGNMPGRKLTTARTIKAEQEIIHRVLEGQRQVQPVTNRPEAYQIAQDHPHLNRAQKNVVEEVLSSADKVQGIQGFAGAGKTTTLSVLRAAAEGQGYEVQGFAPTSRAAKQLREAGIEAGTLQAFLSSARPNEATVETRRLYFVDESSLASTRQVREFLTRLGPNDRVLLIGDTRQHQGVEAGRPFEQLQQAGMRTAKLDEIVRQRDPALKSAVELLAHGQSAAALDPVRIVELTDAQALETSIVENLQRRDVHPLDEATGYVSLLHLDYTVEQIAAKCGKSPAYVAAHARLAQLAPAVTEAFGEDDIGVGHALLLARLQAEQQEEALAACYQESYTNGSKAKRILLPVRHLQQWIEHNILLELATAPFSKDDAQLVPEAGSCVECPKRTGHNTLLFAEIGTNQPDSCSDPKCYTAKIDAHVKQTVAAKPTLVQISTAYGQPKNGSAVIPRNKYVEIRQDKPQRKNERDLPEYKTCRYTTEAIVTEGTEKGETKRVCTSPECPVHHPKKQHQRTHADVAFKAEQEKRHREEALAQATGLRVLKAIGEAIPVRLMRRDLLFLAERLTAILDERRLSVLIRQNGIGKPKEDAAPAKLLAAFLPKAEESKLGRILVEAVILMSMHNQTGAAKVLGDAARAYKVDVDAISATVKQEFAAKEKGKTNKKVLPKSASKSAKKAAA